MPKSWEERYKSLSTAQNKKQAQAATNEDSNILEQFNEYCKHLNTQSKYNKKELFELFKTAGQDAWKLYTQKHPETPRPRVLHIVEDEGQPQTPPQQENIDQHSSEKSEKKQTEKTEDASPDKNVWLQGYEKSFTKWVKNNTFDDGTPKRDIKINKTEDALDIDITPIKPTPRRPDKGVSYHFENGEQEDTIDVTVTNHNQEKPLNYDYVYALVKSAKDNGIDTIEFKDVKTPEFANMLMVASLQFDMTMTNQPEFMIDDRAPYIPKKLREKITDYNKDKKPIPNYNNKEKTDDNDGSKRQPRPRKKTSFQHSKPQHELD